MKHRFYSKQQIEARTDERLAAYERQFTTISRPPVPLEQVIENVFDLYISWERIQAENGETILGALRPLTRQIVLNEEHRSLFEAKPGLEWFMLGHELGHWDLFTDHATLNHPSLPGFDPQHYFAQRSSTKGEVEIIRLLVADAGALKEFQRLMAKQDVPFVKTAVDYYSGALSMPRRLMVPRMKGIHDVWDRFARQSFKSQLFELYEIAAEFGVTITALQVRLEQLDLLCIDSTKRKIFRNRAERDGQLSML